MNNKQVGWFITVRIPFRFVSLDPPLAHRQLNNLAETIYQKRRFSDRRSSPRVRTLVAQRRHTQPLPEARYSGAGLLGARLILGGGIGVTERGV